MKTFDIVAMVVFGAFTITAAIASFFNASHIITMIASAVLTIIAYCDYKKEKKDNH
jgi:intracellular septation protein A